MKSKCKSCGWKSVCISIIIVIIILFCFWIRSIVISNEYAQAEEYSEPIGGCVLGDSRCPPLPVGAPIQKLETTYWIDLFYTPELYGKWIVQADSSGTPHQILVKMEKDYPSHIYTKYIRIYEAMNETSGEGINLTYEFELGNDRAFELNLYGAYPINMEYKYRTGDPNDQGDIRFESASSYIYPLKKPFILNLSIPPEMETTLGRQLEKKNLSDIAITYTYFKLLNPPNPFDCNGKPPWLLECCGIKNTADAYEIQIYGLYINNCRTEKERYYQVNEGNNTFFEKRIEYDLSACVNKNYSIILCDKKEECQ